MSHFNFFVIPMLFLVGNLTDTVFLFSIYISNVINGYFFELFKLTVIDKNYCHPASSK